MSINTFLMAPKPVRIYSGAVTLIALHSIVLGMIFVINPLYLLNLFNWSVKPDIFYLRQAGIFHILLGSFYLLEFFVYRAMRMLVAAKCSAVIFLSIQYWCCMREPAILASVVGDAIMLAMVIAIAIRSRVSVQLT